MELKKKISYKIADSSLFWKNNRERTMTEIITKTIIGIGGILFVWYLLRQTSDLTSSESKIFTSNVGGPELPPEVIAFSN